MAELDASGAKPLSGLQKAAALMLLLGEERSAAIWEHFNEQEVKVLSLTMAELGAVKRDAISSVAEEFSSHLAAQDSVFGSFDRTEAFLNTVLSPEKAQTIMDEIRGQASRSVWHKLTNVDINTLVTYLKAEHPQTVALILSRLPSALAATALTLLPAEFAVQVLNRMLKMNSVQRDALDHVEQALHSEFLIGLSRTSRRDPHEGLADIFNAFDRGTEARLMGALEQINEESATRIKELMFTFEDLTKLQPAGIQTLLRVADRAVLARALKTAAEPLQKLFMDNMSSRAAKGLQDDLEALGPMRVKDVDAAQRAIVQQVKDLADRGEITIGGGAKEDELV